MNKKYVVKLTEVERTGLQKLIATGKAAARPHLAESGYEFARVVLRIKPTCDISHSSPYPTSKQG